MTQDFGTIIIGAGIGGGHLAAELRKRGYAEPISLIGAEPLPPYHRPDLSKKVLVAGTDPTELLLRPEEWYTRKSVTTFFGACAEAIDPAEHTVTVNGKDLGYEKLVLATGSKARTLELPGADLGAIHTLRDLRDATAIREEFGPGKRLVVIGGGWVGLEVAAAARLNDCEVTVLLRDEPPLRAALGTRLGQHFEALHLGQGVSFRTDAQVTGFSGETAVNAVDTTAGSIPADFVVIGIGADPRLELAEAAGLDIDNGVLVDEHLVTSDPDILAVGDIANALSTLFGQRLRVEHWDNALRQAKLAAATITEAGGSYDWLPYFYTDQFDLGMEYVGRGRPDDEVVIRGEQDSGEFIAFWTREGSVTAAMNVNVWDYGDQLRALIGKDVPAARLADESVPVGDL